jgi:PAS domain S-box-containing protein
MTPNLLTDACEDMLMSVSAETLRIIEANGQCLQLGYGQELVGKSILDLEADLADVFYWNEIAGGSKSERIHADGIFVGADGTLMPVTKSVRHSGNYALIHARRRNEDDDADASADSLALMRATLESVTEGIIAIDPDGKVLHFNRPFARIWGLSAEMLMEMNDRALLRQIGRQIRHAPRLLKWLRKGLATRDESMFCTIHLQDERVFDCRAQPQTSDDQLLGRVFTLSDITERMQRERDLAAARDAALAAAKAKSDFLAVMSHEIRTPMNGILGMASLLADTDLDKTQHDYLGIITQSGDALLGIINDILDFSRIDAGKLELHMADFSLRDVIEGVTEMMATKVYEKHLSLAVNIPPEVPLNVHGDAGRLRQIFVNLIGNAVKFTEQGGISIAVAGWRRRGEFLQVCFEVNDTGIGIPEEAQARLFSPFEQVDGGITRRYGGTGLGLSITRKLVHLMGGIIDFRSKAGVGSTFRIILNFPVTLDNPPPEDLSAIHVAIIMPDTPARGSILPWLKYWNIEPVLDAETALKKGADISAALIDPFDAASHVFLAKARAKYPDMRLVQMLPLGAPHEHNFSSMFLHTLAMPLKPEALMLVLKSPTTPTASLRPAARSPADTASGLRILVVEDNLANQKVISLILRSAGYECEIAHNGLDAIEHVTNAEYDVILMDCQMPEMDGVTATVKIREMGIDTPIIALTAGVFNQDKETCLGAGMNAFLTKPVQKAEVLQTIQAFCPEVSRKPAPAEEPPLPSSAAPIAEAVPSPPTRTPTPVPYEQIMSAANGDEQLARVIVESVFEGIPPEVAALVEAMHSADWPRAKRVAHTLKGLLRTVYMTEAIEVAESLEGAAMMGYIPTPELWQEYMDTIDSACDGLQALIEQI